jgi:hypothetical protein
MSFEVRDWLPRHWRELNKRGQILIVFGLIWIGIGGSVLWQTDPPGWEYLPFIQDVPRGIRAGAWAVTGLAAIAYAWRPHIIRHDGFGFLALYLMPAERAALFFLGWVDYMAPWGGPGYARGLYAALVWLVIVIAVMICATWPDPPLERDPRVRRRRRGGQA